MFKFTQSWLLLPLLVIHLTIPCSAEIQNRQTDVESDVKESKNLFENLRQERGEQLQRSQPSQNAINKVAFFVGLNNDFGPVNQVTDVIFDAIITNIGSAYGTSTGRFSAPIAGAYQFNVNVAAQNPKTASVILLKNGLQVTVNYAEYNPSWGPSSQVAILSLVEGDQVWLQVGHKTAHTHIYGTMHTTFSGFLIFEN